MKKPIATEIWETLSAININKQLKKKGQFSYLSWTYAWEELMKHYPDSSFSFRHEIAEDHSVMVWCTLCIASGDESVTRQMFLPVMNNRNQAIQNPNTRAISDAYQRCLVKTIAMFGLGLYVYAGEDLPKTGKDAHMEESVGEKPNAKLLKAQGIIKKAYFAWGSDLFEAHGIDRDAVHGDESQVISVAKLITEKGLLDPDARRIYEEGLALENKIRT
tara:strand:+ start:409 stop:1062 length:654 start_codon:yes stop_codon:yes gene_type:complete